MCVCVQEREDELTIDALVIPSFLLSSRPSICSDLFAIFIMVCGGGAHTYTHAAYNNNSINSNNNNRNNNKMSQNDSSAAVEE